MVYDRPDGQHRGDVSTQSRAIGIAQSSRAQKRGTCVVNRRVGEGQGNEYVHLEAEVEEEGAEHRRQEKRTERAGVERAAELAHGTRTGA